MYWINRSVTRVFIQEGARGFPDQDVFVGIVADAGEWTVDLGLGLVDICVSDRWKMCPVYMIYGWLLAVELKQSTRPMYG